MAYQAYKEKHYEDHCEQLGNLRESACKASEAQESCQYRQQEKGYYVI